MIKHLYIMFISISFLNFMFTISCSDNRNPVSNDDQTAHFEAIGLYLIQSGDTIVSYIGGTVTGQIEVAVGNETPLLYIKFITDDGTVGVPQDPAHSLALGIADTSLAETEMHEGENWEFHVKGKNAGQTGLEISILHYDHPDFVSKQIPVTVRP